LPGTPHNAPRPACRTGRAESLPPSFAPLMAVHDSSIQSPPDTHDASPSRSVVPSDIRSQQSLFQQRRYPDSLVFLRADGTRAPGLTRTAGRSKPMSPPSQDFAVGSRVVREATNGPEAIQHDRRLSTREGMVRHPPDCPLWVAFGPVRPCDTTKVNIGWGKRRITGVHEARCNLIIRKTPRKLLARRRRSVSPTRSQRTTGKRLASSGGDPSRPHAPPLAELA